MAHVLGRSRYLPYVVDAEANTAAGPAQCSQVVQLTVAVKKSMLGTPHRREKGPGNLSGIVDSCTKAGNACRIQVRHLAVCVKKGVLSFRRIGISGYLPRIIDTSSNAEIAPQSAQIGHLTIAVQERMTLACKRL